MTKIITRNESVSRRRAAAYWYAVGHADAVEGSRDRSAEFEAYCTREAEAYYVHNTAASLASIPDQWRAFTRPDLDPT